MLSGDPVQATALLHQAWNQLTAATASGIPKSRTASLEATIRTGLDQLYLNNSPKTSVLYDFGDAQDVTAMTVGPDGSPYYIGPASDGTGASVWRLDTKRDRVQE